MEADLNFLTIDRDSRLMTVTIADRQNVDYDGAYKIKHEFGSVIDESVDLIICHV